MRIYQTGSSGSPALGLGNGESPELLVSPREGPRSLEQWLIDPTDKANRFVAGSSPPTTVPPQLGPPIFAPSKILCVGRNYADHAAETGADVPSEPLIFSKLATTLIGHGHPIVLPAASPQVDFEAELVVIMGRQGRNIARAEALEFVAGYTCGNDITARDWQKGKPGQQWLLGKSFDTFAPLGPCFVTADEITDPQSLAIELRLNGEVMQQANTRDMIFPVARLIEYISTVCTINPGDLLFTGTPSGVGIARDPQVFLKPGDQVEVEVEGIGRLANQCVRE